jgi:hypothetical protein
VARGALPLYLFGPLEAPVVSGRIGRPVAITSALAPSVGAFLIARVGGTETLWLLSGVGVLSVGAAIVLRKLAQRMDAVS